MATININATDLDCKIKKFDSDLLMNKQLKFEPNENNSFGHLYIYYRLEDHNNNGFYVGELVDGKPHGKGEKHWNDGDFYVGDFVEGKRHDKGVYYHSNCERYEGEHQNGLFHGEGAYFWSDGEIHV